MGEIYDLMRTRGVRVLGERGESIAAAAMLYEGEEPIAVDGNNVAQYLGTFEDNKEWGPEDFPNLAPPWPSFIVSYAHPDSRDESAAQFVYHDLEEKPEGMEWVAHMLEGKDVIEMPRWIAFIFGYTLLNGEVIGPLYYMVVLVTKDGGLCRARYKDLEPPIVSAGSAFENFKVSPWDAGNFLAPALMTVSLLHCKNIDVVDHQEKRAVRRRVQRETGEPYTVHKTLMIEPMKKVLRSEGGSSENGIKRAMHITRGHFAVYSRERPLFGRYAGTFWKPQHIRGKASVGTVEKQYQVTQPKS